jgi:hypothetical protein
MRVPRFARAAIAALVIAATLAVPTTSAGDTVLRRDGSKAVPVVVPPEPAAHPDGFDWGDAGVGAGAAAVALLIAAAGLRVARRQEVPA